MWKTLPYAGAFATLVLCSSRALAAPCAVWPDQIARLELPQKTTLEFLIRTADGSIPGAVARVGGLFFKHDVSGQCARSAPESTDCRKVGRWQEYPAVESFTPAGEHTLSLLLSNERGDFEYEGVFFVEFKDNKRDWLNNPTDNTRNFWFTIQSTETLPLVTDPNFLFSSIPTTATLRHWSNPDGCKP
jgi:hypothetical protein